MPITTKTVSYYDDFSTPDVTNGKTPNDKNYLRILFKPGYSVQVRELNQMQSMLQSQIDKFGGSVWKDGVAVIGGNVTFDNNISAIDISSANATDLTDVIVSTITSVETTIANADLPSSLTADVIGYKPGVDGIYTLYIRYKNSVTLTADQTNVETFSDGAVLGATSTLSAITLNLVVNGSAKFAAGIFLDKGLFFTKGCFVATPSQSVFIDKLTGVDEKINGSGRLFVYEKEISTDDDSTLYDNANDTLNFKAPGADRYAIDLTLGFLTQEGILILTQDQEVNSVQDSISLITVVDNRVVEAVRDRYTSLDRELAKRTFEESGNYALKPFKLELKECFKDTSETYSLGRYVSTELTGAGITGTTTEVREAVAKDKYYIGVDPSVAYVDGFRVEPPSKTELLSNKARGANFISPDVDIDIRADIGSYVVGTFSVSSALPDIQTSNEVYNIGIDKAIIGNVNEVAVPTDTAINSSIGILKVDNVADLQVGMPVTGSIFSAGTTITSINRAANTVTLSAALVVPAAVAADVAIRSAGNPIATITEPNHGLVTGNIIYVTTAYNTTIPLGTYGVTVIGPDTFTIVTPNTTAISGGSIEYRAIASVIADVGARNAGLGTATITENNHGLVTGASIVVTTPYPATGTATIPVGIYDVVVLNANTFTIVTPNTTAIVGSSNTIAYRAVATFGSGTAKIKAVESNFGSSYRFYLYDIVSSFNVSNINRIRKIGSPGSPNTVTIVVTTPITATNSNTNAFLLPYTAIENVDAGVVYNALLFRSAAVAETNKVTFDIPSGHVLSDISPSAFILTINGVITSLTGNAILSNNGARVTLPTVATVGDTFNVIVPTTVTSNAISKDLLRVTNTRLLGNAADSNKIFTLPHAQIVASSLSVIYNTSNNSNTSTGGAKTLPSSDFTIVDDGQRDNHLTNVKVQYNGTKTLQSTDNFFFTYDTLVNNPTTGFSTVNSYSLNESYTYSDIPSYKGVRLTDVIDFRPVILSGVDPLTTLTLLNPGSLISLKANYYLPKIDKVVVGNNNKISVIEGVPSLNPIEPVTPDNTMALYTLEVPAYTHNISDISLNYINNRRYTMRDISSLDQRISNVEYYTALSLLEKSANDRSIGDALNASRFKNGIIVDAFVDFNSADTNNSAYNASIDRSQGILRPAFTTSRIDLKPNTVEGVRVNTNSATLEYTESPYITQGYASESESVNPYDIATYVGTLNLSPSSDEWQETKENVTNNLDLNAASTFTDLGTVWGEWTFFKNVSKGKLYEQKGINKVLRIDAIATETINDIKIKIIPFIRPRKIYFSARNLKPNTVVYPFFDNINVSSYVKQVNISNPYIAWKNRTDGEALYTGQTSIAGSSSCKTDAAGNVQGIFVIPNNNFLKFKSGARQFKLSDNISNNANSETTYAVANYTAAASTKTVNSTLTTTRVPTIVERNLRKEKKVHKDPIAQSFLIDDIQSPSGVFLSSVELYFETKSETLPVNVAIVTMENGFPSQNIVPFSEVTLTPYTVVDGVYSTNEIVKTSSNASSPTKFEFSDPVYLNPGNEYALVITSNDSAYRAFVSSVGGNNIPDGRRIDKNPYSGVMFMSANASTWTADQNRDIKFTLNRAVFDTNTLGGSITFLPENGVGVQSVTMTDIGAEYTDAPVVTFGDGVPPVGGTLATGTAIFDSVTGTVTGVTITNAGSGYTSAPGVTFAELTSTTTATGTVNLISIPISTFNLTQNNIEPYATNIDNQNKATVIFNTLTLDSAYNVSADIDYNLNSTLAIDSTNKESVSLKTDFTSINDYVSPLIDLDNVSLLAVSNIIDKPELLFSVQSITITNPGSGYSSAPTVTIAPPPNGTNGITAKAFATIASGNVTAITITNPGSGYTTPPNVTITGNATGTAVVSDTETLADAGTGLSRYITRTVDLNQPADRLSVFVDVNRPSAGSYIKVYAKTNDVWNEMIPANAKSNSNPENLIPISADASSYSEVEYTYTSNGTFESFSVKIVFVSNVIYTPTTVRNFRAIATSGI